MNPKREFMSQKYHQKCKKFNLDDPSTMMCFENVKVGKNEIKKVLLEICLPTGIPTYTNHCLRATAIAMLKGSGFEVLDICKLSSHVSVVFLNHYNASNSLKKKQNMAKACFWPPSTSLMKKKMSLHLRDPQLQLKPQSHLGTLKQCHQKCLILPPFPNYPLLLLCPGPGLHQISPSNSFRAESRI